jgi:hypothetical protein
MIDLNWIIWRIYGMICYIPIAQIRRGAIATPSPPRAATFALIKLLPLAAIFCVINGRSPVNPNLRGFQRSSVASRATKLISVNSLFRPFGRNWRKSIHRRQYYRWQLGENIIVNDLASQGWPLNCSLVDQINSRHGFSGVAIAVKPASKRGNRIASCLSIGGMPQRI